MAKPKGVTPSKKAARKMRLAYGQHAVAVHRDLLLALDPTQDPKTRVSNAIIRLIARAISGLGTSVDRQFLQALAGKKQARIKSLPVPQAELNAIVKSNVNLIQSLSSEAAADLRAIVAKFPGQSREQLTATIQERFEVTKSKAEFWAVDQTLKANADLTLTKAKSSGFNFYRWSTSKDARVRRDVKGKGRPDHVHLEGTTHGINEPPIVEASTGRRAHPGQDYRCRCIMVPLFDDEVLTDVR